MHFLNTAYLLIGGNVGDRQNYLKLAEKLINDQCGRVIKRSAIYETAPWGNENQAAFLNQALEIHTAYTAADLMRRLLDIEEQMGRERLEKNGPRTIDIDILLFNDEVHSSRLLTIPHAEMQNRQFALRPLSDIAESVKHPVLEKTIRDLLAECPDKLEVVAWEA